MSTPKTGRIPPLSEWRAWVLMAVIAVTPPAAGTAVLAVKLDGMKVAVEKNTTAADENTLELARRSVLGEQIKDHEDRLRKLERP